MFGSTCEYVSRVMAIVACPSISDTILGEAAHVGRCHGLELHPSKGGLQV
jgi:hypothetical protein